MQNTFPTKQFMALQTIQRFEINSQSALGLAEITPHSLNGILIGLATSVTSDHGLSTFKQTNSTALATVVLAKETGHINLLNFRTVSVTNHHSMSETGPGCNT
ncbi:MAG: hypothetical protein ACI9HX_000993 [Pseudoalteromonas tetraodonis]|jgi:hypothetical protein